MIISSEKLKVYSTLKSEATTYPIPVSELNTIASELLDRRNGTVEFCPECGERLVIRVNRSDGSKFYGCSSYPICKHTQPLDGEEEEWYPLDDDICDRD